MSSSSTKWAPSHSASSRPLPPTALLIESFPVPPSHIPTSPLIPNPPLSLPPSTPLPPVPGPSSISELESLQILSSVHSKRRSVASLDRRDSVLSTASSIRSRRRDRLDPSDPPVTRFTSLPTVHDESAPSEPADDNNVHSPDDSISSISMGDLPPADDDDDATSAAAFHAQVRTTRSSSASHRLLLRARNSIASDVSIERPASPDIKSIIQSTPRPRRSSSTRSLPRVKSFRSTSDGSQRETQEWDVDSFIGHYGPTEPEPELLDNDPTILSLEKQLDGNDSDSSLDLHTPLCHLMIRHGVLSPRSKVLPQTTASGRDSTLSFASNASKMNHPGIMRDERDTPQRRMRHKDGRLLRGGIGLTTGLGWSDSEDEDAPSPFTKRISKSLSLSRKSSQSSLRQRDSICSDGYPAARPRLSSGNPPTSWNRRSKSSLRSSTGSSSSLSLNIPDVPPLPTGMRTDFPSTPSSASSNAPLTPDPDQSLTTTASTLKRDKKLPPLPPGSLKKYPSTISLRPPGSGIPNPSLTTSATGAPPRPLRLAQSHVRSAGDRPAIPVPSPALKSRATSQSLSSIPTAGPKPLRLSQSQGPLATGPAVPPKPRTGTGMVYRTSASKTTPSRPTLAVRQF